MTECEVSSPELSPEWGTVRGDDVVEEGELGGVSHPLVLPTPSMLLRVVLNFSR